MKHLSTILVLTLAAVALLFATGCELPNFNALSPDLGGPTEDDTAGFYTLYCLDSKLQLKNDNFRATDGLVGSPINGMDCSVSTEIQMRPLTISEARSHGLVSSPSSTPSPVRAATSSSSLINDFAGLFPLMFPPRFPASDRGKIAPNCPSTLGFYLVNHTQGTVTSLGLCPLRIMKVIPVRSHPLQLQLTPDASTLLVTSYDGALNFIDADTDTVSFTLNLPIYNPSGIAISPDGTRAYVTHYLDIAPALLVIDIPNRKLLTTIPLPAIYPRVVTLTPDGSQAWVNYYNGNYVTIVDTLTNTVSGTLNVQAQVTTGMAFNPTGTRAFVAVYPSSLYVVDTATLSVLARVPVGALPGDVVVTPDGNHVFLTGGAQEGVWDIDARLYTVLSKPTTPVTGSGARGLLVYR